MCCLDDLRPPALHVKRKCINNHIKRDKLSGTGVAQSMAEGLLISSFFSLPLFLPATIFIIKIERSRKTSTWARLDCSSLPSLPVIATHISSVKSLTGCTLSPPIREHHVFFAPHLLFVCYACPAPVKAWLNERSNSSAEDSFSTPPGPSTSVVNPR